MENPCVHHLLAARAALDPGRTAVSYGSTHMTYRELNDAANRLARCLRERGVRGEDRVGVCLERSAEAIVAMAAVVKAGAAYVPMDVAYPRERLAFMTADMAPRMLITRESHRALLSVPDSAVVSLDADASEVAAQAADDLDGPETPDWLAYVMYTSGSTGRPKGVAVTHRGIIRLLVGADYVRLGPHSRIAQVSSISFDVSTFEIWGALVHGGRVVGVTKEQLLSPALLRQELDRGEITDMVLSSSLFRQLVGEDPGLFRTLDTLLVGGEPVDPEAAARVRQAGAPRDFKVSYGPTEATTFAATYPIPEVVPRPGAVATGLPLGRAISNTSLYVLDDRLDPCPPGTVGELCIGGPGVARCYLNRPRLTADRFTPDLWGPPGGRLYRTGDLVRQDPSGDLEFVGRADTQVKLRGFRIELAEIEAVLREHPAVDDAAAVLVGSATRADEQRIVAFVHGETDAGGLRDLLRARLPEFMVPAEIIGLPEWPLNDNGKLDRRALSGLAARGRRRAETAAEAPEEARMRSVWEKILTNRDFGVTENFFEIGGNSLLALRLLREVERGFQVKVSVVELYQNPTVRSLMRHLLREDQGASPDRRSPIESGAG